MLYPTKEQQVLAFDISSRVCSASETLKKLKPQLPYFGITRVADITGLDSVNIPTAICIRPNAKHLSIAHGKGLSKEQAIVSAIMESIESYHVENIELPVITGNYQTLSQIHSLINPNKFNQGYFKADKLETVVFDWVKGINPTNNKECYIPKPIIDFDSTQSDGTYSYFEINSTGLASGNTRDEAIQHSLLEVIERKNLKHWESCDTTLTEIDIDSITDSNKAIIEKITTSNLNCRIWEVNQNISIPTFLCQIGDTKTLRHLGKFYGSGCHLNKSVALCRALIEAAQTRLTSISAARDDLFPQYYLKQNHKNTAATQNNKLKNYNHCLNLTCSNKINENIETIYNALATAKLNDIVLIDLTKDTFNIPVTFVFCLEDS